MKKIKIALVLVIALLGAGCANRKKVNETLHVVTFNVRYDNPDDGINRWEKRLPVIKSYFAEKLPDLIGMQEVKHNQLLDLLEILPGFDYVGTGRDDGKHGGEYTPVFFRKDKFTLLEHSRFWLSETPEVPGSIGWDAAITRIVTWAKFQLNESGEPFYFFNTHFDHRGVQAREMSPGLLADKITEIAGNSPVIVTGDFNINQKHPVRGRELHDNLTETLKSKNSLVHTLLIAETQVTTGGSTSTGFRPDWQIGKTSDAIDYIFVNDRFKVETYRVDRIVRDSVFISDHWPVVSHLRFER